VLHRSLPWLLTLLLGLLVVALPAGSGRGGAVWATGVGGDDVNDGYIATGSVLLGPTFDGGDGERRRAAACPGCRWRLATVCRPGDLNQGETCPGAYANCPVGGYRMRIARWTPSEPWWTWVGQVCVGPGIGPISIDEIGAVARDRVERLLPRQVPALQPARVTLTALPTVAVTGQPRVVALDLSVAGHDVRVEATASWTWDFGDGVQLRTLDPGRAWPDATVTHVFRAPGARTVVLTSTWSAVFTVDDLGPFDVPPPALTQVTRLPLIVRQARSHLVH
jgi:hypothetical protein